ncbi:MAG: VOC family protein [Alphaproteobacteria bacterium]|nr:VOC family protein [Alphaproteobacteria bacterium]
MLDYVTVGTNDLKRAGEFYDAVLGVLGGSRSYEGERLIMWSGPAGAASLAVITPFDKNAATPGNGTMIALAGSDPETVQAVHAKALEMGADDEGAPGPRGTRDFYGGYFRDPDGNKLVAYCRQAVT